MSHNANTDKPQLTLIKRKLPISKRVTDEFEFDFDFGQQDDLVSPPSPNLGLDDSVSKLTSFSELLQAQTKIIQRIQYFADELEFNLE